jgi:hypothetical protein
MVVQLPEPVAMVVVQAVMPRKLVPQMAEVVQLVSVMVISWLNLGILVRPMDPVLEGQPVLALIMRAAVVVDMAVTVVMQEQPPVLLGLQEKDMAVAVQAVMVIAQVHLVQQEVVLME